MSTYMLELTKDELVSLWCRFTLLNSGVAPPAGKLDDDDRRILAKLDRLIGDGRV